MTTAPAPLRTHAPATGLPPVPLLALALLAVTANLRVAMSSLPPLRDTIVADLHLSNAAHGRPDHPPGPLHGAVRPCGSAAGPPPRRRDRRAARRTRRPRGCRQPALGRHRLGAVRRDVPRGRRHRHRRHAPAGPGQGAVPAAPDRPGHRPLHAGDDGRRRGVVRRCRCRWPTGWGPGRDRSRRGACSPPSGRSPGRRSPWASARHRAANPEVDSGHGLPWRHRTAWLVAAFMALQSWLFYSCLAWVAPSFQDRGWDATTTGYLLSVFSGVQVCSGLLGPLLADRVHDRRVLLLSASVFGATGSARPGRRPRRGAVALGGAAGDGPGAGVLPRHGAADRLLPHAAGQRAARGDGAVRQLHRGRVGPHDHGRGARRDRRLPRGVGRAARSRRGADPAGDAVPAHAARRHPDPPSVRALTDARAHIRRRLRAGSPARSVAAPRRGPPAQQARCEASRSGPVGAPAALRGPARGRTAGRPRRG